MPRPARLSTSTRRVLRRGAAQLPAMITRFDNGLVVITREDRSAPVVSAQAWCRTGSIHEDRWLGAGLSHVLEHMLFKGTERRTGYRIDQEVQEAGGYLNAYTSFDRTVYWINVPSAGAATAVDILCDITQHATLPPEELAKELDVIRREMDMNHDDPGRRSSRRLFETAYTRSPYRFTIIGYPDLFNRLQPDDIRAYYRARYVPNNLFFVMVGDFETARVLDQMRTAFAGRGAQPLPALYLPEEPVQTSPREVIEEAPIELGHLHFSWHIPDLRHPDVPALDVLATILGSGRSSRLHRNVREKLGYVHSAEAWTYSPGLQGLLGVSAVVDANRYGDARAALMREVVRICEGAVTAAEVHKAVKQFTASTLATRKTMQGQAQDLGGSWLAADDLDFSTRYLEAVQRVTPADLRRVARTHLGDCGRSHYALLPTGSCPRPATQAVTVESRPVELIRLPNGLTVLLREDHRLPFVEFRAVFRGGILAETADNNGANSLLTRTLLKGTRRRSAEQIALEIESVGGSIDSYGGSNSLGVQLEVLSEDFRLGLDLLADVLRHAEFPEQELQREREMQLAAIRAQRDQLLKTAGNNMRRALFGERGYGLDSLGTEASVGRLDRREIRDLRDRLLVPANGVLALFGDLRAATVRRDLTRAFGGWERGVQFEPDAALSAVAAAAGPRRLLERRPKKQAVLVVGFPGTDIAHPDRYALDLLQEACSDLGSRLFLRIRERLGLAYYVGGQNLAGLVPGYFALYAGTTPENAERVEQELLAETRLLATEGLAADELERAQAKIIGQRKIARQDLGQQALAMALDELYGLGYAHADREDALYQAVTPSDILAAARRCFDPDLAIVSTVLGE